MLAFDGSPIMITLQQTDFFYNKLIKLSNLPILVKNEWNFEKNMDIRWILFHVEFFLEK